VTSRFFDVLGVKPIAGRTFRPTDVALPPNVVVLSEGLWRTRFGADPTLVGRVIRLDEQPFTVLGIVPAGFQIQEPAGLWTVWTELPGMDARAVHFLATVGRLKRGVTLDAARGDMAAVADSLAAEFPTTNKGRSVTIDELQRISPWRFRAALSPDIAARAEGRTIDFQEIADFCRAAIARTVGSLLIEGIGGIMVPLDPRHTVLDLMVALNQPLILVAGSYLGTLSHILSAQDVILSHRLDLCAVVISESEGEPPPLCETLVTLGNFITAPLIGLTRQAEGGGNSEAFQRLAELVV